MNLQASIPICLSHVDHKTNACGKGTLYQSHKAPNGLTHSECSMSSGKL